MFRLTDGNDFTQGYCQTGSFSLPSDSQDTLLNMLDNEQSYCQSIVVDMANAAPVEHSAHHQLSAKHPKIANSKTPSPQSGVPLPPPVPLRTPPAVPKRKFISPKAADPPQQQTAQTETKAVSYPQQQKPAQPRPTSINTDKSEDGDWPKKSHTNTAVPLSHHYPPIPPPTNHQKPRQSIRNQLSTESPNELQNSTVLRLEHYRPHTSGTVVKNQPLANQQYCNNQAAVTRSAVTQQLKQQPLSSTDCANVVAASNCAATFSSSSTNTTSTSRKPKLPEMYTGSIITRRKILPPPPTKPPPSIPYRKVSSEFSVDNSADVSFENCPVPPEATAHIQNAPNTDIPPPLLPVNTTFVQKSPSSNKVSIRQDSSISSDSFSQTSSPSYTTKTMETPLLPYSAGNTRFCNGKLSGNNEQRNSIVAKNSTEIFDMEKDGKKGSTALTKSISTPASLQTIVKFHNGSNMSLHHRIIRDMRRPSSHYVTGLRLRFRLAQVVVNALALLAIGGGLAAYFKAYPVAVQIVSNNVTTMPVVAPVATGSNPAPGVCLPVIVNFCQYHRVPYNFTVFPNYMGHFGQRDAQQELEVYDAVVDVRCYELAALFLCSVFVPKCGPAGQVVRPCRSLCFETKRRCGFFLDVFGLTLPEYLECGLFPESSDPNTCVGHNEVKEAQQRALKPVCSNGFQCDAKRCIPKEWQCDGHVDCKDQSDELNCVQCAKGMIHCGSERCMAQEHMCDGKVDCPFAQDERNCLRLSERNGDEGRGQLEIFRPEHQQWIPACVSQWDQRSTPADICSMLGYASANTSHLENVPYSNMSPPARNQYSKGRMHPNKKNKKNLLKEFGSCHGKTYPTVDLICTNYVCGKIRKSYAETASLRIIGGSTSKPGDWPFLAALLGGPEEVFYCAGVLIADQWVLTASHCVGNHSDVTGWTIQLGVTRRHSHSYYGQKMKVRRVIPHPLYNIGVPHDNDVALFQLAAPVTFHEHLLPVCLPPANKELLPGTVCTVIGWGKKEDKEMSEYEPAVNEVQVPVLNRDLCNSWLENRELNVTDGMICAGYKEGGKDACQGDSGGPLLCRSDSDDDQWFVGGIVSWGIKCAHPHLPGVYAYVPKYIPWIKQQMDLFATGK